MALDHGLDGPPHRGHVVTLELDFLDGIALRRHGYDRRKKHRLTDAGLADVVRFSDPIHAPDRRGSGLGIHVAVVRNHLTRPKRVDKGK